MAMIQLLLPHTASIASFNTEHRDETRMGFNLVRRVRRMFTVHGNEATFVLWGQTERFDLHVADLRDAIENLNGQHNRIFTSHNLVFNIQKSI